MKRQLGVFLGVLTSALVSAGVGYASTGVHNIHASYANIRLLVNNKVVPTSAEPFIYNANVYVPISTVAHALDAQATWVNKPAAVNVRSVVQPLQVYYNGTQLAAGITDGNSFYDVPALDASYLAATGVAPTVGASGDVNFEAQSAPTFPLGSTALMSLTPAKLYGDFANTTLYPQGQLFGYWPASVLGQMYPGQFTMEWAVVPGQNAVVPGVDYALDGKYQTLTGKLAVDDLSKNFGGSIQLVFMGDGRTLGSSGWIQAGQEPAQISVPVSGVNTLEIQYQMKDANGSEADMGSTYQSPTVNPDGSKTDPIAVVDLMGASLS